MGELEGLQVMMAFPWAALIGPAIGVASSLLLNKKSKADKGAGRAATSLANAQASQVLLRNATSRRIEGLVGGPSAFSAEAPFQLGRGLGDESNLGEALGQVDFSKLNEKTDLFQLIGALPTSAPAVLQNALLANQNVNLRAGAIGDFSSGITSAIQNSNNLRDILGGLRSSRESGGSISTGPSGLNVTSDFFRD